MKAAFGFALLQLFGAFCADATKVNTDGLRVYEDGKHGDRRLGGGSKKGKNRSVANFCSNTEPSGVLSFEALFGSVSSGFQEEDFPVQTPFMLIEVADGEGVLVEASVSTFLLSAVFNIEGITDFLALSAVLMTVRLTNVEGGTPIDPVPAATLPLHVEVALDEVLNVGGDISAQQSYGRFLFTGVPEGTYILQIAFNLGALGATLSGLFGAENDVELAGAAAFLGNHLISVEKVEDTYSGECSFINFGPDSIFEFQDTADQGFATDLFEAASP